VTVTTGRRPTSECATKPSALLSFPTTMLLLPSSSVHVPVVGRLRRPGGDRTWRRRCFPATHGSDERVDEGCGSLEGEGGAEIRRRGRMVRHHRRRSLFCSYGIDTGNTKISLGSSGAIHPCRLEISINLQQIIQMRHFSKWAM
jgi:hypothetical protein